MRLAAAFVFGGLVIQGAAYFEPNRGQADARLAFIARTQRGTVGIRAEGLEITRRDRTRSWVRWEGASPRVRTAGEGRLHGVSHYALDRDPARWVQDVPHYSRVLLRQLYRGIDLSYHVTNGQVEFDFLLAPGADPAQIRLKFSAAVNLTQAGALELGSTTLRAPCAWQTTAAGKRTPVDVRFVRHGPDGVRFQLGSYDRNLPLIIDPVIEFSTYLGGSDNEGDTKIATGADGAIFVAGTTISADFPASTPAQSILNRPEILLAPDAYVARLKPDGSAIEWSLFIGGNGSDVAVGLKRDDLGNLYLLGGTTSPNFPVTPGAYRSRIHRNLSDLFVVKLDALTGRIKTSTFLGIAQGASSELARLAVDTVGGVYVAGYVYDDSLQTTPGAYQRTVDPVYTTRPYGFALRMNAALSAPVYSTFLQLGGIGAVDVDSAGNLVVGGWTPLSSCCTAAAFPAVNAIPGVSQKLDWPPVAYIAKLNAIGTSLVFASLLHGEAPNSTIYDLKVAADAAIHVAGWASGPKFPQVNPIALQADSQPTNDPAPFLAKLPAAGGELIQSTVFYGPQFNTPLQPVRLVLLPNGAPCISGFGSIRFQQTAGGLVGRASVNEAPQFGGTVACVNEAGTALASKTMLPRGAIYAETASLPDGTILFGGTSTGGLPTTPNSVQPRFAGAVYRDQPYQFRELYGDAFLTRLSFKNPAPKIDGIVPDTILLETAVSGVRPIDIYGSGFAFGPEVSWNGQMAESLFVDSSHIVLPAVSFDAIQPGANQIRISLPGPGGGSSEMMLAGVNPVPSAVSVSPVSVTQGAAETRLVIRAVNLTRASTLYWNGEPRSATYVPDLGRQGRLELLLPASELTSPAAIRVAVGNPSPGGGISPEVVFAVQPAAGAGVPTLANPSPVLFGGSIPAGPNILMNGSGFTVETRAYWDGTEVPVEFLSSSRITIQPPGEDLTRWGAHDVYVTNGSYRSVTVRQFIARAIPVALAAVDAARQRLYALSSRQGQNQSDVFILDLKTGNTLATIPEIAASPRAIAVSTDGRYLFVVDGYETAKFRRYDTETGTIDLEWTIEVSPAHASSLVIFPVRGLPETLVVPGPGNDLTIYDRDRPRPGTALSAGFAPENFPIFVTQSRVYMRTPTAGCWRWLDYDDSGVTGGPDRCSPELPGDAVRDGGAIYLTDGERNLAVSLPATSFMSFTGAPPVLLIDPPRRRAYRLGSGLGSGFGTSSGVQLTEFNLDNQEQRIKALLPGNSWVGYLGSDGSVLILGLGWIALVP